jgi:hypothetical protein
MTRAWLLAALLAASSAGPIRSHNDRIVKAMEEARRRSSTFRGLVDRVERSDLIVYVESGHCGSSQVLSCVALASAAHAVRYLRITIDTDHSRQIITSQIAHELQHAVEIADAPSVVDNEGLRTLYRRIGKTSAGRDVYETTAAIRVAATVSLELGSTP